MTCGALRGARRLAAAFGAWRERTRDCCRGESPFPVQLQHASAHAAGSEADTDARSVRSACTDAQDIGEEEHEGLVHVPPALDGLAVPTQPLAGDAAVRDEESAVDTTDAGADRMAEVGGPVPPSVQPQNTLSLSRCSVCACFH